MSFTPSERERGQATLLGLLFLLIFIFLTAGLVDIYAMYEARDWGYTIAQQAALAGVSAGRDWTGATTPAAGCTGPGAVELQTPLARSTASNVLNLAMTSRGVTGYTYDVRVLPDYDGGSLSGYPPSAVRLGSSGNWSSNEPAVGVYVTIPVFMFLLSLIGRTTATVHVFASAAVAQPPGVCPP